MSGAVAVGDRGLLVPVEGPTEARALATAVAAARWPGVLDAVVGMRSVLITAEPGRVTPAELIERVAGLRTSEVVVAEPRLHRLPVVFDGPDLEEVCRLAGVSSEEVAATLATTTLEVAMLGFSPGFAYLTGLPRELAALPRRAEPRASVPAGSVALAGGFAAVYPQSTPGGWQLVGRTPVQLFDPVTPPFALLRPGDTVRLDPVPPDGSTSHSVATTGAPSRRPPLRPPDGVLGALVVEEPGLLTTVQDAGRLSLAHLGVPGGGPADPLSQALANRLVGNPWHTPALEVTVRGPVLRCLAPVHVAVVGGDTPVSVDGREVGTGHVVPLAVGQRLTVGPVRHGVRCALAVAGGLAVTSVLGSSSTDVLSWLGPGPLINGDMLGVVGPLRPMADRLAPDAPGDLAGRGRRRVLRVLPGPHPAWFPADVLARLAAAPFVVGTSSDRVGLRLVPSSGATIERVAGELDSQGVVTGAIQVPPDGRPVVLGPDHATVGGYPVAAVVAACDGWLLGQCGPGDEVELLPVTADEAAAAFVTLREACRSATIGRYPSVPA